VGVTVGIVERKHWVDTTAVRRATSRLPGRDLRREQIIKAALSAIEENGPHALTGQIADKAGLGRTHFYRHFASKEELDLAVARYVHRELTAKIRLTLGVRGSPLDVIRAPVTQHVVWADENPNLYRFLVNRHYRRSTEKSAPGSSAFASELALAGARYFPRYGEDSAAADRNVAAIMGLIDASVLWWLDHRDSTREELVVRLTRQTWLIIDDRLRELGIQLDPQSPLNDPTVSSSTTPASPR
jgi:AcrR family transcriptional regulator